MAGDPARLTDEEQDPRGRRTEERAATMFRPVLIEIDSFVGFCLVRNLSTGGMKGQVYARFTRGQRAVVRFGCGGNDDRAIEGVVVWSSEGQIGVQFDTPIEVAGVLADLARPARQGQINRAPRLPIDCVAELDTANRTQAIEVQDISQRGIKAQTSAVRSGDEVTVRLPGLEPRKAVVRWTTQGSAGLAFLRPFGFEELAAWVITQNHGMAGDRRATAVAID